MSKKFIVAAVMGMGILFSSLTALAAGNLFKNYVYGTPLASYKTSNGYYDCSEDVGGVARCIDGIDFIGHKFTAALIFSGSKLIMLSLISPYDSDLLATSVGTLAKTFKLSVLSDTKSQLDVIQATATARNRDELATQLTNYEGGAISSGTLTYTFYEGVDKDKRYTSVSNQLAALPDNVRAAEIVITGEGPDAVLIIRFGFPKLETNKVLEASKKPIESF